MGEGNKCIIYVEGVLSFRIEVDIRMNIHKAFVDLKPNSSGCRASTVRAEAVGKQRELLFGFAEITSGEKNQFTPFAHKAPGM